MMQFGGGSLNVAEYVEDLLLNSNLNWQSITIIPQGKYAGCCVTIVTDGSSDVIVEGRANFYSLKRTNI